MTTIDSHAVSRPKRIPWNVRIMEALQDGKEYTVEELARKFGLVSSNAAFREAVYTLARLNKLEQVNVGRRKCYRLPVAQVPNAGTNPFLWQTYKQPF